MSGRISLILVLAAVQGCGPTSNINSREARETVEAIIVGGEGEGLVTELIEISTNFSLGVPVEDAAVELGDWYRTEIPCASVAVDGATVNVDFGADGSCVYRDNSYGGVVTITVLSTVDNAVQIDMTWTGIASRGLTLDGTAQVTWSGSGGGHTREVVHEISWTRADGSTVQATGTRLQALLVASEGLSAGLVVSGSRNWSHGGDWHVAINDIEISGLDPVPLAGGYTVLTPHNKEFEISFDLNEDDTIHVVISGNIQSYSYNVTHEGEIVE